MRDYWLVFRVPMVSVSSDDQALSIEYILAARIRPMEGPAMAARRNAVGGDLSCTPLSGSEVTQQVKGR